MSLLSSFIPRPVRDWRFQLAALGLVALALRLMFFVGFGLGDDLGYIGHVTSILNGAYPPLELLNQYAYRPLLLYLFTGGVAAFGYTDLGVVAPVTVASIATVFIIYMFVRRRFGAGPALWCATLFAFQPFNVVDSTTMTNDVILSCLIFSSVAVFLTADAESDPRTMRRLFVTAAALLVAAFLVKMTLVPVLFALGLYTVASLKNRASIVWRGHSVYYVSFLAGLSIICLVYYVKTGDPLWQFRSELDYYQTYKPDWYLRGDIDYSQLMWEYPRSLFWSSGYGPFRYLDHGLLFWLFVPCALWAVRRRDRTLSLLVVIVVVVFLFFEFYPQYVTPTYLPLVRQTRYLEMLLPAAVIVVGAGLYQLAQKHRAMATFVMVLVLGDFVYEASRRHLMFDDSQQDMRALGEYAAATIQRTHRALAVDMPASASLQFYLRGIAVPLASFAGTPPEDSYVAVGGARSFWWSRDLVFDVPPQRVPANWVLAYEVPGRRMPWRPTNLRVYYVGASPEFAVKPLRADSAGCQAGLRELSYPTGFEGPQGPSAHVTGIPDVDADTAIRAAHLEWVADFRAQDDLYTFEMTSDDGSWLWLNDRLVLDNGGNHPAKKARTTMRLARGLHAFRLRFEDTGGEKFLRFRVYRGSGASLPDAPSFCVESAAGPSADTR